MTSELRRRPFRGVILMTSQIVVREPAPAFGHAAAALDAARRVEREVPTMSDLPVRMIMRRVQGFGGESSHAIDLPPRGGLSVVDRVLIATQRFDPRTSARSSQRVRDFLDFLIDEALATCP